ncbi:hypothetical protein K0M31_011336 [Melipona bicolor]|uniref:Uncharacterized protein n=1 Tax=Melipona bicolor TaxID=60889 RepID=A0AA40KUX6_9HYME|nr:hypothetical protein K0M31_011336 [Melipona bicolor]
MFGNGYGGYPVGCIFSASKSSWWSRVGHTGRARSRIASFFLVAAQSRPALTFSVLYASRRDPSAALSRTIGVCSTDVVEVH